MSWIDGVDLVGMVNGAMEPNLILHVARLVHTPEGSAPAGMVLYQPDLRAAPEVIGFVCTDTKVGAYFGPKIFAGTPFESVPILGAEIRVEREEATVRSTIEVTGHTFVCEFRKLGALESIHREVGPMPFLQQGLEAPAGEISVAIDGKAVEVQVPAVGLSGGASAVWAPVGIYAR